jgi:predicted helicase
MPDKKLARVFHYDLYGIREEKYEFLYTKSLKNLVWENHMPHQYNYSYLSINENIANNYLKGFSIGKIWGKFNPGVETGKDDFFTNNNKQVLTDRFKYLDENVIKHFGINDNKGYKLQTRIKNKIFNVVNIRKYLSNPFDIQYCYFDPSILRRASYEIQKHIIGLDNIFLICKRGRLLGSNSNFTHISISTSITDKNFLADQSFCFPIYLYSFDSEYKSLNSSRPRKPNFNPQIVQQLAVELSLTFTPEKESTPGTFAPIDILDYIYAILHSPSYRSKYKEFLKIDFPRIPYPKDQETFWRFVKLGSELRQIHLLESPVVERFITSYPITGNNEVGKVRYEDGKVWINDSQYFDHVPQVAWEFYIGGYQPA